MTTASGVLCFGPSNREIPPKLRTRSVVRNGIPYLRRETTTIGGTRWKSLRTRSSLICRAYARRLLRNRRELSQSLDGVSRAALASFRYHRLLYRTSPTTNTEARLRGPRLTACGLLPAPMAPGEPAGLRYADRLHDGQPRVTVGVELCHEPAGAGVSGYFTNHDHDVFLLSSLIRDLSRPGASAPSRPARRAAVRRRSGPTIRTGRLPSLHRELPRRCSTRRARWPE